MAASDSLNSHLFDDLLQAYHGVSIDQALKGYSRTGMSGDRRVLSPEEMDEYQKESVGRPWHDPMPRMERVAQIVANPRPLPAVVHDWMMNHRMMGVGPRDVAEKAMDLKVLGDAIREGSPVPKRIYRGAEISPQEQAEAKPTRPLSFSEDHLVARIFSRGGGKVFKAEPGEARGIYVPDFVERQRTVGPSRRPEREWLIDPSSIAGRS